MLAHWRLTPKQLSKLSEDELEVMTLAYRLYERRNLESLSDLVGTLTGTSWSVDALTQTPEDEAKEALQKGMFTWSKRPLRQRISLPLTVVVGGAKVIEHVKKTAATMKENSSSTIISLPRGQFLKGAEEIIDLAKVPKSEFLKYARHIQS